MSFFKFLHPNLRRGYNQDTDRSSANFAFLSAINDILKETETDTINSKIESHLDTASGQYLDEWGSWFGVPRKTGQSDDSYREWIITYTLLKRGTKQAIISAIRMYLNLSGATISVYEPYKNVFTLDKSALDGVDHLPGDYYRWGIIDIYIDRPVPKSIEKIIRDFKPAGVNFFVTIDTSSNKDNQAIPMGSILANEENIDSGYFGFDQNLDYYIDPSGSDYISPSQSLFILDKSKVDSKDILAGGYYDNLNLVSILDNYGKEFIYGTSFIGTSDVIGGQPWNYQTTDNNYNAKFWSSATIAETKDHISTIDISKYTQEDYASHLAYINYTGVLKGVRGNNTTTYENLLKDPQNVSKTSTRKDSYYEYEIGDSKQILGQEPQKYYLLFSATRLDSSDSIQIDLLDNDHILLNSQTVSINEDTSLIKINYDNEKLTQPDNPFIISQSAIGDGEISSLDEIVSKAKYVDIYVGTKGDSKKHKISLGQPCLTSYEENFWVPYQNDSNSYPLVQDGLFSLLSTDNTTNYISLNSNGQSGELSLDINVIGLLQKNHQDFWGAEHISGNLDIINYLSSIDANFQLNLKLNTEKVITQIQNSDGTWNNIEPINNGVYKIAPKNIKKTGIVTFKLALDGVDSANIYNVNFISSINNSTTPFKPTTKDSNSYLKFFGKGLDYTFYNDLKLGNKNPFISTDFGGEKYKQLYVALNVRKQIEERYDYMYKHFHNPESEHATLLDILKNSGIQIVGDLEDNQVASSIYSVNLFNLSTSSFDEVGTLSKNYNSNHYNFNFDISEIENYLSDSGFLFIKVTTNNKSDNIKLILNDLYITGRKPIEKYSVSLQTNASVEVEVEI